ncbi:ISAs1 family transposase, partial [Candidatus Poribacteria bacterium]
MTNENHRHLLNKLAEVPDKRNPRGKRHPLSAILGLSVVAMMCGYRSYSAIAQWGRTYPPDFAIALGFTYPKTPCASTLYYCFRDLDVLALEKTLSEWATEVFTAMTEEDMKAVAIDGKTLRGSLTQDAQITHL